MPGKRALILSVAVVIVISLLVTAGTAFASDMEKVLYSFCSSPPGCADGNGPQAGLVFDTAGRLYGTTDSGGAYGVGTVFQLSPGENGTWTETVTHSFDDSDGAYPYSALVFDAAGNLYGTTQGGGADYGTVFELMRGANGTWTSTVLHSFGRTDGTANGILIFDAAGNLYGTTLRRVFELTPGANGVWTEKVLHTFSGKHEYYVNGGLVFDGVGNLYGTSFYGGIHNYGTVFELTPGTNGVWTKKVLRDFSLNGKDGFWPYTGSLTLDGSGNLYGATSFAFYGGGAVFELTPGTNGKWTETVLHKFRQSGDGAYPWAELVFDEKGNLYGTTPYGGTDGYGTVYELTPGAEGKWAEKVLHSFGLKRTDGVLPNPGLVVGKKGHLYGTTLQGGIHGAGTIFEIMP